MGAFITPAQVLRLVNALSGQSSTITVKRVYISLIRQLDREERVRANPDRKVEDVAADYETAILLDQILFWAPKSLDTQGWFYKTYEDWEAETELTISQLRRAADKLKGYGLIATEKRKLRARTGEPIGGPILHYRPDWDVIYPLLLEIAEAGGAPQTGQQASFLDKPQAAPKGSKTATPTQTTPKAGKGSQKAAKTAEERGKADDPVEVYRDYYQKYPNGLWAQKIREAVTPEHVPYWRKTLDYAVEKGWYLGNMTNLLRCYNAEEALTAQDKADRRASAAQEPTGGVKGGGFAVTPTSHYDPVSDAQERRKAQARARYGGTA